MTRYIARFMKNVLGENGHEVEICQRVVEVEAATKNRAWELAEVSFCQLEKVGEWGLHADSVVISEAANPDCVSRDLAAAVAKTSTTGKAMLSS